MSQASESKFLVVEISVGAIEGQPTTRVEAKKILDMFAQEHPWGHWAVVQIVEDYKPQGIH